VTGVSAAGMRLAMLDSIRQDAECRLLRQVDELSGLIDARDKAQRSVTSHLSAVLATHQLIAETIAQMHQLVHRSAP